MRWPRPPAPLRRACLGTSHFICHQSRSPAQLSKQGVSFSFQLTKYQGERGFHFFVLAQTTLPQSFFSF